MYYLILVFSLMTNNGVSVHTNVQTYPGLLQCEVAMDRIKLENRSKYLTITGSCTAHGQTAYK